MAASNVLSLIIFINSILLQTYRNADSTLIRRVWHHPPSGYTVIATKMLMSSVIGVYCSAMVSPSLDLFCTFCAWSLNVAKLFANSALSSLPTGKVKSGSNGALNIC